MADNDAERIVDLGQTPSDFSLNYHPDKIFLQIEAARIQMFSEGYFTNVHVSVTDENGLNFRGKCS